MLGAIAGDIIGSVHEFGLTKTKDFPLFGPRCRFTDDTVMTAAIAQAILTDGDYRRAALDFGRRYPGRGYGGSFRQWLAAADPQPYGSYGNGAAMRASPVGFAFSSVDEVLREAARSAAFSHDHPEGVKGAQAAALAAFLARTERDKALVKAEIASRFGYDLDRTVDAIRPAYTHVESCQETVPEAVISFLESTSYEDAVRNAVSLGGDADTLACIAGGIAEAFYGPLPPEIVTEVREILTPELRDIVDRFYRQLPR
ncbi:MAG: ADP-ribosylglycohydrolase family protein [Candidatus Aminicenantes bacterium]|nr:ADP-ribosylglycohydrolase family protein [Candidatus Aminicenantes bacterium]NLH76203.1 ADP-ribosylglycohydrolase family protein [Acidobacteriota bacterium]